MKSAQSSLYSNSDFEAAFTSMARSAGVSHIEDVVERFRTQKSTFASLEDQQTSAESDVREMGKLKEELEQKFAEVRLCCGVTSRLVCLYVCCADTLDRTTVETPERR